MKPEKNLKNNIRAVRLFVVCALAAGIVQSAGCGYTSRSVITEKFKTIYIPAFINKIDLTKEARSGRQYKLYRPFLESDITRSVINGFLADGNLRPVSDEVSDLVLRGELVDFRRDALRYDKNDDVVEYRVSISVNLALIDRKEDKTLWKEDHFTGSTTYFAEGSSAVSEDKAITDAFDDLARRIVERTVEDW